jgi:ribonucleotide reductase beta subunit family protein with ferritin-like domain
MDNVLLKENPNRFTLFPIIDKDIWEAYKIQQRATWTAEEIDYSADLNDWDTLSEDEKYFIENILAFFAGSDGIVLENLIQNFCNEVQLPEAKCVYSYQAYIENVHSEVYSLLIDTYVNDNKRKHECFNAIEHIPCIKKKADWALKWVNSDRSFAERLIAFSIVEGIFFSGSFCAIFWLKSKGKMVKTLGKSNELIARDEGMHTDFAVLLYHKLDDRLSDSTMYQIIREAVDIEKEFICDSLKCNLIGMNKELMSDYIEFVADRLLTQLGYNKIYNTDNPFEFMNQIGMDGKTNFFEQRVTEYQIGGDDTTEMFVIDEDF